MATSKQHSGWFSENARSLLVGTLGAVIFGLSIYNCSKLYSCGDRGVVTIEMVRPSCEEQERNRLSRYQPLEDSSADTPISFDALVSDPHSSSRLYGERVHGGTVSEDNFDWYHVTVADQVDAAGDCSARRIGLSSNEGPYRVVALDAKCDGTVERIEVYAGRCVDEPRHPVEGQPGFFVSGGRYLDDVLFNIITVSTPSNVALTQKSDVGPEYQKAFAELSRAAHVVEPSNFDWAWSGRVALEVAEAKEFAEQPLHK